jgi:hypothetical protein
MLLEGFDTLVYRVAPMTTLDRRGLSGSGWAYVVNDSLFIIYISSIQQNFHSGVNLGDDEDAITTVDSGLRAFK